MENKIVRFMWRWKEGKEDILEGKIMKSLFNDEFFQVEVGDKILVIRKEDIIES